MPLPQAAGNVAKRASGLSNAAGLQLTTRPLMETDPGISAVGFLSGSAAMQAFLA
jgi:hypothetical protein